MSENTSPFSKTPIIIDVAPQIAIRETGRILGEYLLNEEDILEGHRFPDTIGLGAHYLDVQSLAAQKVSCRLVTANLYDPIGS